MSDLSTLFRDERYDITDDYTKTTQEFDKLTFAREILTLVMEDYDALSNLMRVERAPLFTQDDEMVDAKDVLDVELVEVEGMENVAVVTLKQKNEEGEHKKFVVAGDMNQQAFDDFCAIGRDIEKSKKPGFTPHDKVKRGGYVEIKSLEEYEDRIESRCRTAVFGQIGEFGDGLIRFHQVDEDGEIVYRGFIDAEKTPDAFKQVKADQAYYAEHGSLEVA